MEKNYTNRQGVCPMCQSDDLEYESAYFEGEYVAFPYTCNSCNTSGSEWYVMEFTGHNFYDDELKKDISL